MDEQARSVDVVCTEISASYTPKNGKRYDISKEQFLDAYLQANSTQDIADALGCSAQYVRRTAKKYGLQLLAQHGGARVNSGGKRLGAGRPLGSKNKNSDIEYIQMMRQLEIDQRVNSSEIGIRSDRVAIGSRDYFKYAASAYRFDQRIIPPQPGLPCKLKPVLAKT